MQKRRASPGPSTTVIWPAGVSTASNATIACRAASRARTSSALLVVDQEVERDASAAARRRAVTLATVLGDAT